MSVVVPLVQLKPPLLVLLKPPLLVLLKPPLLVPLKLPLVVVLVSWDITPLIRIEVAMAYWTRFLISYNLLL
jgi:hypothetical protein